MEILQKLRSEVKVSHPLSVLSIYNNSEDSSLDTTNEFISHGGKQACFPP